MKQLIGSVGAVVLKGSEQQMRMHNRLDDVKLVQSLLNDRLKGVYQYVKLKEDGNCGPKTIAAIKLFQNGFVKRISPDGRIDRHGETIKALSQAPAIVNSPHVSAFLDKYGSAARSSAKKWNVPASVLLAQAAHESGWGRYVKGNAFFGIKGKSPSGNSTAFKTTEVIAGRTLSLVDSFRAYKDFEEAADDYGRFLNENPRYKGCFTASDPEKFVEILAKSGYATDPNYNTKIVTIIRKNGLEKYDK